MAKVREKKGSDKQEGAANIENTEHMNIHIYTTKEQVAPPPQNGRFVVAGRTPPRTRDSCLGWGVLLRALPNLWRRRTHLLKQITLTTLALIVAFSNYQTGPLAVPQAEASGIVTVYLTSTSTTSWVVPADWSSTNSIQVIGAGGGGRSGGAAAGAGGGGGGAFASSTNLTLTPGSTVTINVGGGGSPGTDGGDTYICNSTSNCATIGGSAVLVGAKGGAGSTGLTGGLGGTTTTSVGTTKFVGGNGGAGTTGSVFTGGGGGGAAGIAGVGRNGGNGDTANASTDGGGGGGGSAGGSSTAGVNGGTDGGNGGVGPTGTAGGTGGAGAVGNPGSNGSGGGGGGDGQSGGNGGDGIQWGSNGSGGGGGGGGNAGVAGVQTGGRGGAYGGGGGGAEVGGVGGDGIIVITYTSVNPPVNLSGTLFSDEGVTQITGGLTIKVAVGTSTVTTFSTTTNSGTGNWNITIPAGHRIAPGTRIVAFVDGASEKATTFTKASSTSNNITGINLYQNYAIISHEGTSGTSTTNTDLAFYDGDDDHDIQYTSNGGALSVRAGNKLFIWANDVYEPGGAVTVHGNAGSNAVDGSFHIATGATYTAGGNTTVAGYFTASTTAVFTPSTHTLTLNATTTGKIIDTLFSTLGSTTFNGVGGAWSFARSSATTSALTITNGTLTAPTTNLIVTGNYTNSGTFSHNSATTTFSGTSSQTLTGTMTGTSAFANVVTTGAGTKTFSNNASTSNLFIESSSGAVTAPSLLSISGNYQNNGTFTPPAITTFMGDTQTLSGTMIGDAAWNTLVFSGNATKTIASNASTTHLINGTSATTSTSTLVLPALLSIGGDFIQLDALVAGTGTTTFSGTGAQTATGTLTGTSAFANVVTTGAGTKTFGAPASTTNLTIGTTATNTFSGALSVSGNLTVTTPSAKLTLPASATTTVLGTTTITGTSGNEVRLRSTIDGTRFGFYTNTYTITYADIKDSSGSSTLGAIDVTGGTNIDSGNNVGWTFTGAEPGDTFTISGVLFESDRVTPVAASQTLTLAVATSTVSTHSTTTQATTGAFSFSITVGDIATSTPLTVFVDGNATLKAVTVTKAQATTTSTTITNLPLYQNHLIVKHEALSGTSTTISDLSYYDSDNDSDIPFTATTTAGTSLTVYSPMALLVASSTTFAPGGAVTINGNASTTHTDGSLHLAPSATYTAGGNTTLAGHFTASSSAVFTPGTHTLIMNATTTNKTLNTPFTTYGNLTLNGNGGAWSFGQANATTTHFQLYGGTVTAPSNTLTVQGNYATYGTFLANGGTVWIASSTDQWIEVDSTASSTFNHLTLKGAGTKSVGSFFIIAYDNTTQIQITSLAIDAVNGVLYAGSRSGGIIYRCVLSTGCDAAGDFTVAYDTAQPVIHSLAIDAVNGVLYAGSGWAGVTIYDGIIYRCVLSTGCDAAGDFTVAYDTNDIDVQTLIIDTQNGVLYAGSSGIYGIIYRCLLSTGCDASGDFTTAYDAPGSYIQSLTIDAVNGVLYAGTRSGGIIYRCALSTGCDEASDFTVAYDTLEEYIYSLAIDAVNGTLYAGSGSGGIIYRCALSTGCDEASDFTVAYDTTQSEIYSLTIDAVNGVLYAGSGGGGIIYRCLLLTGCDASGDFTVAYDTPESTINSLAIDAVNGVLYAGSGSGGIIYRCALGSLCSKETTITLYANNLTIDTSTDLTSVASTTLTGNLTQNGSITWSPEATLTFANSNQNISGTLTGNSRLPRVVLAGSGTKTFSNNASTSVLTINTGTTLVSPNVLTVSGNFTQNGTYDNNGGILYLSGYGYTASGTMTGTSELGDLRLSGEGISNLTVAYDTPESTINSLAIDAVNGTLYAGSGSGGIIYRCALSTGCDEASDFTVAYDTTQSEIYSLTIDAVNGVLYAGSGGGGIIYRCLLLTGCDASGDFTVAYDTPESTINSLAIDAVNGVLYAGSTGSGIIYRCLLSTGCDASGDFTVAYDTSESYINSLAIDAVNGTLYAGSYWNGIIYRCALSTGCDASGDFTVAYDTSESYINSLTIDAVNGVLYAGSGGGGIIYRCLLSTGCDASGDFTVAYDTPESTINSLAIDAVNGVLYAGSTGSGIIYRCLLSTGCDASGDFTVAYDTSESYINSLAIDAVNGVLYAGSGGGGIIYRCLLSTGCDASGDFTVAYDTSESYINSLAIDAVNGVLYAGSGSGGIIYRLENSMTFGAPASTTNLTIDNGHGLTAPTALSISGNYSNSGGFYANSGTTTFSGASAQTATGTMTGTSAFANVVTTGAGTKTFGAPASTTNLTIGTTATNTFSGPLSVSGNLTVTTPSAKLALPASATTTVAGVTTVTGTSGGEVRLRSTVDDTQFGFALADTYAITYADVKDSSGTTTGGLPIDVSDGTTLDSGGNNGWNFGEPGEDPTLVSVAHQTFIYGAAATPISPITITEALTPTITATNNLRIRIATSTVNMRFDTTDTTAVFGGTAASKVAGTVSYEQTGGVLVIDVTENFIAGDTLTISGLAYTSFNTVNSATPALTLHTGGVVNETPAATDTRNVTIMGALSATNHPENQVQSAFTSSSRYDIPLYRFTLTPQGENAVLTTVTLTASGVQGIEGGDLSNLRLYHDVNADGLQDGGDTLISTGEAVNISGQSGTLTLTVTHTVTVAQSFVLLGDVANIRPGDQMNLSLSGSNLVATGNTTSAPLTPTSAVSTIQHNRGGQGTRGISSLGPTGGDAPGGTVVTGGGQGTSGNPSLGQTGGGPGSAEMGDPLYYRSPTSGSNGTNWFNVPGGAYTRNDGLMAELYIYTSGSFNLSGFGLNIPSTNQILGIEVRIVCRNGGSLSMAVQLSKGSSKDPLCSDMMWTRVSGGSTDLWGTTWTANEVNGMAVTISGSSWDEVSVSVDAVTVRVYHQATGGGQGGGGGEARRPGLLPFAGSTLTERITYLTETQRATLLTALNTLETVVRRWLLE